MSYISVIIPCYNCAAVMGETLISLEKQTSKNFEVVCINDGSTDNTLEVLNNWKEKSELDITVIDQKNSGVSSARNAGIAAAKGNYLLFLDADDIYNKYFIEKMFTAAEKYDVCFCRLSRDLEEVLECDFSCVAPLNLSQKDTMRKLLYEMGNYAFTCYLYKKEILVRENILFDESTRHFEDREFNWKYLCHCKTFSWIDAPLYGYRINNASVTRRPATWHTDGLAAIERVEAYLEAQNIPFAEEVKSYLFARAIWGLAKAYAQSRRKDYFLRLKSEFNLNAAMKQTAKDPNKLVRIASLLYLIHPMLFYYAISITR